MKDGQLQAMVTKPINDKGETARFPLTVSFLKSGVARVTVDEERRQKKDIELRHNSPVRKERYNEAEKWVIVGGLDEDEKAQVASLDKTQVNVKYGPDSKMEAVEAAMEWIKRDLAGFNAALGYAKEAQKDQPKVELGTENAGVGIVVNPGVNVPANSAAAGTPPGGKKEKRDEVVEEEDAPKMTLVAITEV